MFKGLPSKSVGMDLMLVDIPEDLAILEVSNPDGSMPFWTQYLILPTFTFTTTGLFLLFMLMQLRSRLTSSAT
jgi:hypothetical protein